MRQAILHSDLNSFYYSVEAMLDHSLRGKTVAVCGSVEDRHGIILAKSELAKRAGREGGKAGSTLATVFNSADEAAVEMFMKGRLSYLGITEAIERAMDNHKAVIDPTLDDIYAADTEARAAVMGG